MVRSRYFATLVCFILLLFVPAKGQSPNGTISGLVTDSSGAVIVGADVLLANDATGVQYSGKTNGDGMYVLPNIAPGSYRLQVSKTGFKTVIKPEIVVEVQSALAVNFSLPVGATAEVVTVVGGVPLINTESGSVSTVVDHTYIENMPLNGRSFQDLILLTPGTVTQNPQVTTESTDAALGSAGEFSVNGQRPESNYYTVDGVSANVGASPGIGFEEAAGPSGSVASATALGTTQALVSVDDLQEFRVQTSSYSAEYGRNPGGQFSFETKSGTNEWHGDAYDYVRNGFFDARDWFNDYFGLPEPALRQNDFGGTFGGPLEIPRVYNGRGRSFFFASYEGLRLADPQAATLSYVPDATLRTSAPAPLNQALNAFPLANGPEVGNGIAEFIGSWSNASSLNSTSVRFDHVFTEKLRTFFRFSDTPSRAAARGTASYETPSEYKVLKDATTTYTAGATVLFSPRMSDELRLNYSSTHVTEPQVVSSFGGNTPTDLATLAQLGPNAAPSISLLYGGYDVSIEQYQQSSTQKQWNFVNTVDVLLGRHQLKFGADYRRLSPTIVPFGPTGAYYFLSESEVQTNSALAIAESFASAHPLYTNFSAFVQDSWKSSQRLTLSYGLRWEVNPAPGVTSGLKPYTVQGSGPSTWSLAPQGTALWHTTWYNLAPRIGVAYVLRRAPSTETVLRGGAGIFYDTGQQLGSQGFIGPGFNAEALFLSSPVSFPLPVADAIPAIVNPPVAPYNAPVYAFSPHLQAPYTAQWNLGLEQALGESQALGVSYVGAHGVRLLQNTEISGTAVGNPNAPDGFYIVRNGLTSDYNALQLQFRRKLSDGLTALASYTFSHCIDYGSQDYFFGYQRGDCDFDVSQVFSSAFSYDFPQVRRHGWEAAMINGWGLDDRFTVRGGFPVTLNGNSIIDPATGQTFHSGLSLVPGQPVVVYGAQCASVYSNGRACPGGRAINPLAFSLPSAGQFGDAPRNFLRGFGSWQMDMAIRRDFPILERVKLQFRAESFNVFNHPNFGAINSTFGQSTFGQSKGTLASTLGILSPLYQMGGPRSLQFALKLIF